MVEITRDSSVLIFLDFGRISYSPAHLTTQNICCFFQDAKNVTILVRRAILGVATLVSDNKQKLSNNHFLI